MADPDMATIDYLFAPTSRQSPSELCRTVDAVAAHLQRHS